MWRERLEPGFLQVFRLYAWLQLASFLLFPFPEFFRHFAVPFDDFIWPLLLMVGSAVLLLGLLYWSWLQNRLGAWLIPAAIGVAGSGLILAQRLFFTRAIFWQVYPFLTVLLILVAWQYRFRIVVLFALVLAILPLIVDQVFLASAFPPALPPPRGERDVVFIGSAFGYVVMVATTFTLLLIGYVINRLVTAQRKQRRALSDANQRLVNHAAMLEQLAVSHERNRLSRELHDTLAHTLSAQTVQIEAILTLEDELPPKARRMLEQMSDSTRSGLEETRRVLSSLRSGPLDELGLAQAVRSLAEDFAARQDLDLELDVPEVIDDLPAEVEQCVYRVVQESLENAARHSGASRLSLGMSYRKECLKLEIRDDGQGFDPKAVLGDGRLGIQGMYERAEMVGAHLQIDSQPGGGARVRLEWEPQA
jgi:signal transduction histidine kinase